LASWSLYRISFSLPRTKEILALKIAVHHLLQYFTYPALASSDPFYGIQVLSKVRKGIELYADPGWYHGNKTRGYLAF
jgi:hypothetical protein